MVKTRERGRGTPQMASAQDWAKSQASGEATAVKLPEGVEWFKLELGTHKVDFMPYVTTDNPQADPGFAHFVRRYSIHRVPGPDGRARPYCCLFENWKDPCPICQYLNSGGADKETIDAMRVKTRLLFLINDRPGKTKINWKVLDTYHFNRGTGFGELLADAIQALGEGAEPFALKDGFSVQMLIKEQTMPGVKFNAATRIDLVKRDYDYPGELLDKAPCLDEMLIHAGYKELQKVLGLSKGGDGDEEEAPRTRKVKRDVEEDSDLEERAPKASRNGQAEEDSELEEEGEDPTAKELGLKIGMEVEYKGEEYTIKKISGDGTSLTLEDEDGELVKAVAPKDVKVQDDKGSPVEEDSELEEEVRPALKKKGKAKVVAEDSDLEEDEEEPSELKEEEESELEEPSEMEEEDSELEDERPARKKTAAKKVPPKKKRK